MANRFLDFSAVRRKEKNFSDLLDGLTQNDLRDLTNSMVDAMLSHLEGCVDADVTFQPHDPNACDMEYKAWPNGPRNNTIGRFVLGLMYDDDHLEQIREIVRQSHAVGTAEIQILKTT